MGFYDLEENVNKYITMAKGFDGRELIDILKKFIPEGSTVLELGMGPGVDLEILSTFFDATGSDNSKIFLDRFQKLHSDYKLIKIDIKNIQSDSKFDCIYSNKVLHHLTDEELRESLLQQKNLLNSDGILFHTFWFGEKMEEMEGLLFNYHSVEKLKNIIGDMFEILEIKPYNEMEKNDSLYVILSKTSDR